MPSGQTLSGYEEALGSIYNEMSRWYELRDGALIFQDGV